MFLACLLLLSVFVFSVFADIYMHNPRGSNDRNCERNSARNNQNRLFDSQNNDQGGYACPRAVGGPEVVTPTMYYYEGSSLQIEYTNQHGCNNDNVNCEITLQYMCSPEPYGTAIAMNDPMYYILNPNIRDGTPVDANDAATNTMNTGQENNLEFGYHETHPYYTACATRTRNNGLWIADQNVGNQATDTRQNPNGNRYGWECQEERDYYPYWMPSPWKDIAVLSSDLSRCGYYKSESQNVQAKYWCVTSANGPAAQNNAGDCIEAGNSWVKVPAWGISPPDCQMPDWSRDNHLGNTVNGNLASYVWTLPSVADTMTHCVFRIRYNVSNNNVDWKLDWTSNDNNSPIKQDPFIHVLGSGTNSINVSLAVNTDQYGRTFQDRSYVFQIKKRSDGPAPASGTIWNLNVRGKRGNIVDVYPSVEYDFVPQNLQVNAGDFVHFQWIGSDYNPNETPNAAEGGPQDPANPGNYRADRSNIVPTVTKRNVIPTTTGKWFGVMTNEQMLSVAYINQDMTKCMSLKWLQDKHGRNNNNAIKEDSSNCMILNTAQGPYYDMPTGPVQMTQTGTYLFQSTRNNNFSNRNQRATITVNSKMSATEKAAIGVGVVAGVAGVGAAGTFIYKKRFQ
jgi:hypothetical protein